MRIILYIIVVCCLGGCASPPLTPSGDPIEREDIPYIAEGVR